MLTFALEELQNTAQLLSLALLAAATLGLRTDANGAKVGLDPAEEGGRCGGRVRYLMIDVVRLQATMTSYEYAC